MDGDDGDGRDRGDHSGEHNEDEPGRPVCSFWRRLGYAHGVDEGVRDEMDELHVFSMLNSPNGSRNLMEPVCRRDD